MLLLLAAIVIGISLGLFGSGGSILTVPVLLYLLKMPADMAIASSLLIVAGISALGSMSNTKQKLISWHHVLWFGVPGMIGTYCGAWLGTMVDSRWQLLCFSALMLAAAVMMWRNQQNNLPHQYAFNHTKVIAEGLFVGIVTGFVGVGGGFLIVPALVLLGGLPINIAIATSLSIIALKSFAGFAKYFTSFSEAGLSFDWQVIAIMIIAGLLGTFVGNWLGKKLPKLQLQRGFAVFLAIMSIVVITQSVI